MLLYIILIIILPLFYHYLSYPYQYWKKRGVYYKNPTLLFGNFIGVIFGHESIGMFLTNLYNSTNSKIIGAWVFRTPILVLRDPKIIKQLLISDFNKFPDRSPQDIESTEGIAKKIMFFQTYKRWKELRTKFTPLFTQGKMKSMFPLLEKTCVDLHNHINNLKILEIEVKELFAKYTTEIVASCIFGIEGNTFNDSNAIFRKMGKRILDPNMQNSLRQAAFFVAPTIVRIFRLEIFDSIGLNYFKDVFTEVMKTREESGIKRNDLVDAILEIKMQENKNGLPFDCEEFVAQGILFYTAGFETTSLTISYACYELCCNQDIQNKLRNEIKEFTELTYEAIQSMKYLNMVVLETLRKYPPLPFITRYCVEDYVLDDLSIEKGTQINVTAWGLHYDEKYFPNPDAFIPERFTKEEIEKRPECTYVPFGVGPKMCLGERFGLLIVKMCICNVLMKYKLEECELTPKKIEFSPRITTTQPLNGVIIRFSKLF